MSGDFPKGFAVAAIIVVLLAVGVVGAIVGYNMKPASSGSGGAPSTVADITLTVQGGVLLRPTATFMTPLPRATSPSTPTNP